jgi:hypothetical protein
MKLVDLTIPLGVATPPWPTYEPLQVKYFKRLAPNGAKDLPITMIAFRVRLAPRKPQSRSLRVMQGAPTFRKCILSRTRGS